MGIPNKSRKGKKAWRKNIDAKEVEEFLVQESHKQVREPAVESLKDEDLFVVDKEADDAAVPASVRSSKRKQAQQKLLRPAAILASHKDGIKPLHVPTKQKAKGPAKPLPSSVMPAGGAAAAAAAAQQAAEAAAAAAAGRGKRKPARRQGLKVSDIWSQAGPDPDQDWTAPTTGIALIKLGKRKQQQQQVGAVTTAAAAADGAADGAPAAVAPAAKRSKRRAAAAAAAAAPIVPAVEVDAPGCSFNPEPEAHQDALAAAVAAEYRKQLADELAPKAPSQFAPAGYKAPHDELDALLVDAEVDDEDEDEDEAAAAAAGAQMRAAMQDENAIPLDDSEDEDAGGGAGGGGAAAAAGASGGSKAAGFAAAAAGRSSGGGAGAGGRSDRKTRKDRNREARRKQQEADAAARAALKQQRRELEALSELQQQLAQEDQEKEAVRLRRQATVAERAANEPPRLGKHRFEAAPVAVMTTDEVTGSLREIKPCFTLTADRFKALQKRGLVEPRKPTGRKLGKKIEYVTGDRQEKAREAQQEIEDLKKARKKAAKSGSAAAAEAVVAMAGGKGSSRRARQKQKQQEQQQLAKKMQLAPGSIMPLEVAAAGTAAGDEGW